jgi:hypothetical protein
MPRLRLADVLNSRLPPLIGKCAGDVAGIGEYVNSAQRFLLYCKESGDEGWNGSWAEMAFNVSRGDPYIVTPREVARLEQIDVCGRPIQINNPFFEYLQFGNGRMSKRRRDCWGRTQAYMRNDAITPSPLVNPPKIIRIYAGDPADVQAGKRVFIGGVDNNSNTVYTQNGFNLVQGSYVTLASPFVDQPMQFNRVLDIQKDATVAPVQIFQVDPVTGAQSLMLTMEPGELVSGYRRYFLSGLHRRYFLSGLPLNCCHPQINPCQPPPPGIATTVQITALAALELIPVTVPEDYLLLQNLEAVIEECCAVRYRGMDSAASKPMAQEKHIQAVRLLNGELTRKYGLDYPAISFKPFGSADLRRLNLSMQ